MGADPELLAFSQKAIEHLGGAAEEDNGSLLAYLPPDLAQALQVPEEVQLGQEQGFPLVYGSPVLDKLIERCTRDIPLVYGRIQLPYLKKQGFEQFLDQDLALSGAKVSISGKAETRTSYMILFSQYIALSDERKEGLVNMGIRERNGAIIEGLADIWREYDIHFYPAENIPPHFPKDIDQAMHKGFSALQDMVSRQLAEFRESMQRRLNRDVRNLQEYYAALGREMEESLSNPNLSQSQREERESKIAELPLERDQKIQDLQHKYNIQVTMKGSAVLRLLVDVVQLELDVRYKKWKTTLYTTWNPLTRRLDPLTCPRCGSSLRLASPVVDRDSLAFLCPGCIPA